MKPAFAREQATYTKVYVSIICLYVSAFCAHAVRGRECACVGIFAVHVRVRVCLYVMNLLVHHIFMCFREATRTFGLWDCLRVDYGREWYLTLYMQHLLRNHRFCETDRSLTIKKPPPFLQTSSKKVSYIFISLSSLHVCIIVVHITLNKK